MNETAMATAMFRDRDSAERAYQDLVDRGYSRDDINIVMSEQTRLRDFGSDKPPSELGTKAMEGAGVGGAIGTTVGAIAAAITAVGSSIAIPGLGIVVAGPIAAALAGAGAGGAAGGLVGALIGWTIPEDDVKRYEGELKQGGILMGVRTRADDDAQALGDPWRYPSTLPPVRQ